jgi:hypothetical protein
MGLARGIERRLERLVDGMAARLFRGRIHPVELGSRLIREADLSLQEGPAGPIAPNHYVVALGGPPADDAALQEAQTELALVVEENAAERGWRLEGPAIVRIVTGAGIESDATVEAAFAPGQVPVWARLVPSGRAAELEIRYNRSTIGRSKDADLSIAAPEVSRIHALIWRQAGGAWIHDLDSSNGTFVNGERISEVLEVLDGDVLTFGEPHFVYRMI